MIKNGQNMQSEGSGMSLTEKYEGGDMSLICKPSAWRIQSKWLCQLKKKKKARPINIQLEDRHYIRLRWISDGKCACFSID